MVDLKNPKGPFQEGINNAIFIIPCIVIGFILSYIVYKLYRNLRDKVVAKETKKRNKQMRRDKDSKKGK